MTSLRTSLPAFCLSLLLTALPGTAPADIAPDDLWALWQRQAGTGGVTLVARTRATEGGLALEAPRLSLPWDGGRLALEAERGRIVADGQGGSVLHLDPGQTLTLEITGDAGAPVTARAALGGDGLRLTASGDLGAPRYAVESAQLVLTLLEALRDGVAAPVSEAELVLEGLSGAYQPPKPGARATLTAGAETATSRYALTGPAGGPAGSGSAIQTGLELEARLTPPGPRAPEWHAAIELVSDSATATARQSTPQTGTVETALQSGPARVTLDVVPERLDYAAQGTGIALTLQGDRLPLPAAEIGIGTASMALTVPLPEAPETGGTAALGLILEGVTAGEPVWSLFDPAGALPRTAADLTLSAEAGLAAVPEATREAYAAGDVPGLPALLPESLTLHELTLSLAEATLEAEGAFATRPVAGLDGVPDLTRPIGQLDLRLAGGMALLQRLIAGGIVPREMALGAQMMLGMFTTPGEGDSLTSTIRTDADGGLVVNGTRLR